MAARPLKSQSAASLAARAAAELAAAQWFLADQSAPPPRRRIVDPVHPNEGVIHAYHARLIHLLDLAHMDISTRLAGATLPTYGFAHDALSPTKALTALLSAWGRRTVARFERMAEQIAADFAAQSKRATEQQMRAAFKRAGWTVEFQPTRKSMAAYQAVIGENVALIKSIGQKYHTDVQEKVWSAVRKGGDLRELSIGLQKTYGISARRAAFISRDQTAKAKAIIEATRDQELGVSHAIWHHSHAGKVPRPTHLAMNGKKFALKDGMYDSAVAENVWPGQLPNCRCSWSPIIEGFEM